MSGFDGAGDLTGFVHDTNNQIQATVYMGGMQHRLTDILPTYLAFTKMSSDYGSQVLINNSQQIACAGTDISGKQMALLLSVDPDTDNDGLPDSWEMQYYGHLGVGKNDLEAGGGGLTNWQAFQQGTNPNDFYNGQSPILTIVSGNNQTAAPGSFIPTPLVVQLSNKLAIPASSGTVTFSVSSGGGVLQTSREGSPKTTTTVITDANGQAQVFFQVSSTAGVTSSINAVPTGTSPSNPSAFQETADSNGPVNPTPLDPNNPPQPEPVPAQAYAVIDVSGDTISTDVNLVTLEDNNVLSFETSAGANGPFSSYVWQNGVLGSPQTTPGSINTAADPNITPQPHSLYPSRVLPTGDLVGRCGDDILPDPGTAAGLFYATGDSVTPSYLPSFVDGGSRGFLSTFGPPIVANNGTIAGPAVYDDRTPFCFICVLGSYIAFDSYASNPNYSLPPAGGGWTQVVTDPLAFERILAVNCAGHAIGSKYSTTLLAVYWDGTNMKSAGSGRATGLNEQNQAILQGAGYVPNQAEGYLWENNGTTTVLVNHLPAELQGQILQIEPFSISNQTAPGTDATIYILANARVNGAAATIVCTRDNDGDWSFAQVGVPDGTTISQYTTINSSGTIAGVGSVSNNPATNSAGQTNDEPPLSPTSTRKALMLPMADISLTFGYRASVGRNSIETAMQGILGFKAPPLTQGDIHTFLYDGKDNAGKSKTWVVQTFTNQDSFSNALKRTPYIYYEGHANDGADFALKKHAQDNDFDPASIDGIDKFMRLRNAQFAIPWRQFHDDEYSNFGPTAVPIDRITAYPTNYAVPIPFNLPIEDGFFNANPERYPNDPDSGGRHVGAGKTFPLPTGVGINQHHMTRTIPDNGNGDSNAGQFNFLVVQANDPPKPRFGYKIFCAFVCNGARDYGQVFNHGCFISTTDYSSGGYEEPIMFIKPLLQGGGAHEIVGEFNDEGIHDITQTNH